MKNNKIALAVVATLFAGTVSAGTLDYRGEYKHKDETFAHRAKIGSSVKIADPAKLYFSIEQKWKSADAGDFWKQTVAGDSEFDWGVRYQLDGGWWLQPGMPITFSSEKTTYKPQFRVGYKADFGLTTALRYRHEFQNFVDGTTDKTGADGETVVRDGKTLQQGKWTLTGSYKFSNPSLKNLLLSYEANYAKNYDGIVLADGEDWEWDAGVIIGYKIDNFRPYMEFWTVDYGSTSGDRQLRTRAGIKYSF
ncbi:oligogalacturonate-specific porin KdgM family protein [Vibrio comitans]|uniref:Porin n=1 Tax=Vibrio comitans NBRC 102076 TaxID=1219078 RepID=A0A4Y3IIN3_9VIBR|nr:oligogalacturonate-specific porin KdgM family protein [Vibrio comitans]GEA59226.1 porin [Vibrio comitans NBRC 102076]